MTTPEIKKNIEQLKTNIIHINTFDYKNLYFILPTVIILLLVIFTPTFLKINSEHKYKKIFYWIIILTACCFSLYIYIKK